MRSVLKTADRLDPRGIGLRGFFFPFFSTTFWGMQTFDAEQVQKIVQCAAVSLKTLRAKTIDREAELTPTLPSGTGMIQRYTWDDIITVAILLERKRRAKKYANDPVNVEELNHRLYCRARDLGLVYPVNLSGSNGRMYRPISEQNAEG